MTFAKKINLLEDCSIDWIEVWSNKMKRTKKGYKTFETMVICQML